MTSSEVDCFSGWNFSIIDHFNWTCLSSGSRKEKWLKVKQDGCSHFMGVRIWLLQRVCLWCNCLYLLLLQLCLSLLLSFSFGSSWGEVSVVVLKWSPDLYGLYNVSRTRRSKIKLESVNILNQIISFIEMESGRNLGDHRISQVSWTCKNQLAGTCMI